MENLIVQCNLTDAYTTHKLNFLKIRLPFRNNNEKFRSFKSKENIHKKEVGPYRGFGY